MFAFLIAWTSQNSVRVVIFSNSNSEPNTFEQNLCSGCLLHIDASECKLKCTVGCIVFGSSRWVLGGKVSPWHRRMNRSLGVKQSNTYKIQSVANVLPLFEERNIPCSGIVCLSCNSWLQGQVLVLLWAVIMWRSSSVVFWHSSLLHVGWCSAETALPLCAWNASHPFLPFLALPYPFSLIGICLPFFASSFVMFKSRALTGKARWRLHLESES